jgi:hypothetical protein
MSNNSATFKTLCPRVSMAEAIRDLVETVTVFRDPSRPGGVTVEIAGRLNALLGEQAYPNKVRGVWGKMVAGEGHATTSDLAVKTNKFNNLVATGVRI